MTARKIITELSKLAKEKNAHICYIYKFDARRRRSEWYGGDMCIIEKNGCKVYISAVGDIIAELYGVPREETLELTEEEAENILYEYVKDKNNAGGFSEVMRPYLKTDKALERAIKDNRLFFQNNNWFEVSVQYADGTWKDLYFDDATDFIDETIRCVLEEIDELVKEV